MKVLVAGAGAVGGYFGGKLAAAGEQVIFAARGANLAALREHGLRIESVGGNFRVAPVHAVGAIAEAGRCDVVLVCVKSYDTAPVAAELRTVAGAQTIVLSLQNGIENEQILQRQLGGPPPMAGLTHIGAELVAPGVVRHASGGRILFGELDGTVSERARRLESALRGAGIATHVSRRVEVLLWDKLMWNAAFNAVTAIARATVGEVLRNPDGRALIDAAMREVTAVARANRVPLDPGRIEPEIVRSLAELAGLRTSMLQDLERGKRLEHDALNGAVVRAAARASITAPIHRTLHALLSCFDPGASR
jgi:2-dehydropantoate 2-reductase